MARKRPTKRKSPAKSPGGSSAQSPDKPPAAKSPGAGKAYHPFHGISLELLDTLLSPILGIQLQMRVGMPVFKEMKSCTVDSRDGKCR